MAGAAPARPAGRSAAVNPWLAGLVLALSNFMVVLDISIANVSVPHISGSLAISPDQGTWVITSYAVAEAICVPLTGWLASRFGTVRTYLVAMTGFAIFSILCGLSVSLGMLVACRVGQGLCGGPIMPLTQTLLTRVFPPDKRGQAMGLWGMTTVVAPIAGPLLGGTISDNWGWHWIFFINLPVAITCVLGSYTLLRHLETASERLPIDVVGLILLVIWVGALQIMLDLGRDRDWFGSPLIVALAIIAFVFFLIFIIWELTEEHSIVDLRVFRHKGFTIAVAALAITYGLFFATVVVTPQWLQLSLGYTASWSGYVVAWQGLFAVVLSPVVGKLANTFDPRKIVAFGILDIAFSMWLRSRWIPEPDYWMLVIPHLTLGAGLACFFVPITIISLAAVEPRETASAAGMSSFVRTFSGAFATSIATTLWANGAERNRAAIVDVLKPSTDLQERAAAAGLSADQTRGVLDQIVNAQGLALSILHLFQVAAGLLVFSAFLIMLAPRPRVKVDPSAAH